MDDVAATFHPVLATTRTIRLSPAEAQESLSASIARFIEASGQGGGGFELVLPGGARARLRPAALHGASGEQRTRLTGTVRSRRGWTCVPVDVEAAPVSHDVSELVVRPVGPVCLRSAGHRRLFQRTSHVLADLFRFEIEMGALTAASVARMPARRPVAEPVPA